VDKEVQRRTGWLVHPTLTRCARSPSVERDGAPGCITDVRKGKASGGVATGALTFRLAGAGRDAGAGAAWSGPAWAESTGE